MARGLGSGKGEEFRVEVESLDQDGRGVAHREGKAVFIEGALPGERVVYERRRNKPSYETGRVVRIERASVLRVEPRCPHAGLHAGACGGCSMQHVTPAAQVAIKQRVLEDTLWHIGRLRPEHVLRPVAGPAWRYRHRARFSVRHVAKKGGGMVDFRLKVVDKDKAALLLSDAEHMPQLHVEDSDVVLSVPGESIETMTLEDDGIIFVLFPNPGGAVKPGTKVSVVFGELRLTGLKAQ